MTVNWYFARNPTAIMGRLERSGTMRGKGELNVKLDKDADLGTTLNKAIERLPKDLLPPPSDEVIKASIDRHAAMSDALKIALAGHEPGHDRIQRQWRTAESPSARRPPAGYEMTRRVVTPESPWSRQLYLDSEGKYYTLEAVGKKEGTKRNIYARKYFPNNDVPGGMRPRPSEVRAPFRPRAAARSDQAADRFRDRGRAGKDHGAEPASAR